MASHTPASDHPAPPSQEEGVKELQSDVKIESEAVCSPDPAPVPSNPEIEGAKGEEKPKDAALATEVEAVPASDQVVKKIDEVEAAKPVVEPPAEAGEAEAEVVCVSVEEKPEEKQVEVQQGIGVAPDLSDPPAEKVEECKIVQKAEDAVIAAPDESSGSEPAEVEKKIESGSSISGEKSGPEPDEKEVDSKPEVAGKEMVKESKDEPVIEASPEKAGPEPAEAPEEKNQELPTKVVELEPIVAGSAAACKPEAAVVEQVEVPEAGDIKLLKEKEISAAEISASKDNECYPTDKLVEQGNLPSELAEEPIQIKGSLEDTEKGGVGEEHLVPCEEKATEDVINFTPEETSGHGKELAAETIEVKGSSDNKDVEPEKVEPKTEEKSVVAEELVPCAEMDSAPPSQPAEEAILTSRDIELEAEKGKNKEALAETEKDVETHEGKEEKTEAEDKAVEAKIEEEKQAAKRDIQESECNKDTPQEAHKGEVKPQKQSIVKMVKQSLVKAKKAIIGKSHNSKTTASEPKDNANN